MNDTEYEQRIQRAKDNLAVIDHSLRALGYPITDDPAGAERIAHLVATAPHATPELGRRIARLIGGGGRG